MYSQTSLIYSNPPVYPNPRFPNRLFLETNLYFLYADISYNRTPLSATESEFLGTKMHFQCKFPFFIGIADHESGIAAGCCEKFPLVVQWDLCSKFPRFQYLWTMFLFIISFEFLYVCNMISVPDEQRVLSTFVISSHMYETSLYPNIFREWTRSDERGLNVITV